MFLHLLGSAEYEPVTSPRPRAKSQVKPQATSRYQELRDSDSTGVYTCDSAGYIRYYNAQAAELWGRKPAVGDTEERFCGAHMPLRTDNKFVPHYERPMADVLAGKVAGVYDAEVFVQRPNGSRIIVIVNIAPLIDDNGDIVGAVSSFCEKSPRKPVNGAHVKMFAK